jgi:hypothetical protein
MIWGLLGGIFLSLLASELYDSCPRLTNLLLRSASRRLPAEYRDRYWEEWMGELDAQGDLGKLRKLGWAFWVFLYSWKTGRTLQSAVEQAKSLALARSQDGKKAIELISPRKVNTILNGGLHYEEVKDLNEEQLDRLVEILGSRFMFKATRMFFARRALESWRRAQN